MPSLERESKRIVIAGASSLLGAELKSLLEGSRFAGWDFRLVDEEIAAGTLTEAGGEAAVIQPVDGDSFSRANLLFFTGSGEFTRSNIGLAMRSGARVIDLSGAVAEANLTESWFPGLEALRGRPLRPDAKCFAVPSAAGTAACMLALALSRVGLLDLSVVFFQPVSEAGREGIEELETQTGQLLSFQSVGHAVFDAQVAFNMLDRFGERTSRKLAEVRERVRRETQALLGGTDNRPVVQVVHAPVFYGTAFTASARFDLPRHDVNLKKIVEACKTAGFVISANPETAPSNVSVAGENLIHLGIPEADSGRNDTWWFWGAADNMRLPAANAVRLAELLA
jgi:aspartate-semialdehyde dehydrogenase